MSALVAKHSFRQFILGPLRARIGRSRLISATGSSFTLAQFIGQPHLNERLARNPEPIRFSVN